MIADEQDCSNILEKGETLTVEFKSEVRPLSGRELGTAVVALANTEGGDLHMGVEDNGRVN
ncbi:MAG: ATP-binding protein [Thermodesulfobacteriota bacterium]